MRLQEIYQKAGKFELFKDPKRFIEFYETNRQVIEQQKIDGDMKTYNTVMRLTCEYAHALSNRENFKKALPQLERAMELFKGHPTYKDTDLLDLPFYEALVFDRAVANYTLNNNSRAIEDLKKLCDKFPDNDKYKNWNAAAQIRIIQKADNFFLAGIVIGFLLLSLVEDELGRFYTPVIVLVAVSLVGTISAAILKHIKKNRLRG